MSTPRVSILMPVRNEAPYLQAALDSLSRQTLTDWELIAVDDGSSDATPDILSQAARRDRRVSVITTSGNGLVPALNAGLEVCQAPLIARMDGDDVCHPLRLELQLSCLEHNPDIRLVACSFRHFPLSTIKQGMKAYQDWQNSLLSHDAITRDLYVESPFVHPSVVLYRDDLLSVGGYRIVDWAEDYDLWLRLAARGVRFARLPQTLFFWRDHPERATRTMSEYSQLAFRACKLHFLLSGFLREVSSVVIAGAGLEGRAWQRLLAPHGITVSAWIDVDRRKIGRLLHGAPVIHATDINQVNDFKILVAIGVHGARSQFRELAALHNLQELKHYLCVA